MKVNDVRGKTVWEEVTKVFAKGPIAIADKRGIRSMFLGVCYVWEGHRSGFVCSKGLTETVGSAKRLQEACYKITLCV